MRRSLSALGALVPNPLVRGVRWATSLAKPLYPAEKIITSTLLPDVERDFDTFRQIITDEKIVFTSSWMDKWFGLKSLRAYCDNFETKLKLAAAGDPDVRMSEDDVEAYRADNSLAKQLALNKFFSAKENRANLIRIYEDITRGARVTGLGYYKFEDEEESLLGGGALAPLTSPREVDIALHILQQRSGIGSTCIGILLHKAFAERGVEEVWGSSTRDHPGTPTLCARHGMIIEDNKSDGMKHYFIDRKMYEATKGKDKRVREEPIAASTYYSDKENESSGRGRGGR